MGLEAGSQLKSQGKWLGVGGPSVGFYVPLLEFNQRRKTTKTLTDVSQILTSDSAFPLHPK